jgi:hypothetical protein
MVRMSGNEQVGVAFHRSDESAILPDQMNGAEAEATGRLVKKRVQRMTANGNRDSEESPVQEPTTAGGSIR